MKFAINKPKLSHVARISLVLALVAFCFAHIERIFALRMPDWVSTNISFTASLQTTLNWLGIAALLVLTYRGIFSPLRHIVLQLRALYAALPVERETPMRMLNVQSIAREVTQLSTLARDYYYKHQQVADALEESRAILAQVTEQHHTVLNSTNTHIVQQYQNVLSYAHYLEGLVAEKTLDPDLRFDFDDVCESSFNLKLIAGALAYLKEGETPVVAPCSLAALMQQTMLALAPSLDRRAMRLTTAEVDESVLAATDPSVMMQVVWMLMLGIVRYAADESTLRMRCFYNHTRERAMLSIVVSELAPGTMSLAEREAHLMRQLQHLSPHMFAETIRIHANMQLANLLLSRLDAYAEVVPLTSHACEICLSLPTPYTDQADL